MDFNETAPEIAFRMHQHAKNITGVNNPYLRLKELYNEISKGIYERITEKNGWIRQKTASIWLVGWLMQEVV